MEKTVGRRRYYQFELKEFYWNMAPPPIVIEGGPGGVCDFVGDVFSDVCDTVSNFFEKTIDLLSDPMSILENPFEFVSNSWDCLVEFCEETWEDIEDAVEEAWDSVTEFCSDAWESVCDVWDDWGKQIVGVVAVVVCSWIPGVNAVVAAAVIGALQAGLESGWDLQAMAVGAAAGAISAYAGGIKTPGLSGTMAKMGCNAASSALQAGQASGWDLGSMGEAALTGAGVSLINAKVSSKLNFSEKGIVGSQTAGRYADNVIKSTVESCVTNGLDSDSVVSGIAGGVGKSLGDYASSGIDTENEQVRGLVNTAVSSATSSAIVASAKGEDVGAAVMNGVKNSTVRYAVKELADQVNNELSSDGKNQKLEEYLGLVTDAVAGAAGSVTAGGDFNSTFKSELNGNLMAYTKKIEKEMEADYKKNETAEKLYASNIGLPSGAGDPSNGMSLGFDNIDPNNPQDNDSDNPLNIDGMSPAAKEAFEKIKNGEEIDEELQTKLQDELKSGLKEYGKEIWEDKIKYDVEKNWEEFTNNPKDYVLNNPLKTAGTVGLAGAAAYGAYEYFDNGKIFDVNTNQLGLGEKLTYGYKGENLSANLKGNIGYKREIENGDASLYLDAEGMIGYKNGDFNGTLKSQFGSDGLNSINADGKYDDFTLTGSFLDEKNATNVGIGWKGDNLSLKGNYQSSEGTSPNYNLEGSYKNGDFNGTIKSQFGSDGLNSINADGKYDDFTFTGSFLDEKNATNVGVGWKGDNLSLKGNYQSSEGTSPNYNLEGSYKNGDFNGTIKSQFGNEGLNSINADSRWDDFTLSGSYMNEKNATKVGVGWQHDNLSLKGNYQSSGGTSPNYDLEGSYKFDGLNGNGNIKASYIDDGIDPKTSIGLGFESKDNLKIDINGQYSSDDYGGSIKVSKGNFDAYCKKDGDDTACGINISGQLP